MDRETTSGYWKPLTICPHLAMGSTIQTALAQMGFEETEPFTEYPPPGAMARLVAQRTANICFLDVASDQERGLLLISEAAALMPVVALNPSKDADLILRCLRRGAVEFVSDPSAAQLDTIFERLHRLRAPAPPKSPAVVYCVIPGKPGSGASTLAAHLALELKRGGAARVLLVDTDYVASSIMFLLKLRSDFHLDDAVRDCLRLDEELWKNLTVSFQGIDVLTAPENPAAAVAIDHPAAVELICFWREHYDAIVVDTPGVCGAATALAALSDEILLVTTNELAVLHATKRSIDYLEQTGVRPDRLKLLVTRYTPATGLKADDLETALHLTPYALLSNDYEAVQKAVLEGKPVPQASHFGRSVAELAQRLSGRASPPGKRMMLFGLLPVRR